MIPVSTIAIMIITAVISVVLSAAIFALWRKKHRLEFVPLLLGIAYFFAFTVLLQQAVHALVLRPGANGSMPALTGNPGLYVLYLVAAGSIVQETGRYAVFRVMKRIKPLGKNFSQPGAGVSFGIGSGGMEAFVLTGLTMIGYASVAVRINSGNMESLGSDWFTLSLISALFETEPTMFLAQSAAAVIAVVTGMALSVIVHCSAVMKDRWWLFPAATVLRAALLLAPSMYQADYFGSIWHATALTLAPAGLAVAASVSVFKEMKVSGCE